MMFTHSSVMHFLFIRMLHSKSAYKHTIAKHYTTYVTLRYVTLRYVTLHYIRSRVHYNMLTRKRLHITLHTQMTHLSSRNTPCTWWGAPHQGPSTSSVMSFRLSWRWRTECQCLDACFCEWFFLENCGPFLFFCCPFYFWIEKSCIKKSLTHQNHQKRNDIKKLMLSRCLKKVESSLT